MSTPTVSVVIAAKNAAETLGEQLASLVDQVDAPPYEVLVADNGSTDRTAAVVAEWAAAHPTIALVDASGRPGPCAARNVGVESSTGGVLLFCDADDVVDRHWVREMALALDRYDVVGGRVETRRLNDDTTRNWYRQDVNWLLRKFERFLPYAPGASLGIRRSVFDAIGGWDEEFVNGTDADLCFRAQLDAGATIGFAPEAIVHYRYRPSMTAMRRQMRAYGRADAQLVQRYRDQGLRGGKHASTAAWLILHAPDLLRGPGRSGRWWRRANVLAGYLEGRIRAAGAQDGAGSR